MVKDGGSAREDGHRGAGVSGTKSDGDGGVIEQSHPIDLFADGHSHVGVREGDEQGGAKILPEVRLVFCVEPLAGAIPRDLPGGSKVRSGLLKGFTVESVHAEKKNN